MMSDKCFLDTNILVYAHDSKDVHKRDISQKLILGCIRSDRGVISSQVLSEFFVTITRKVKKTMSPQSAKKEIGLLKNLGVVTISFHLILSAIDIHVKNKISFWYALIIASAQQSKCSCIYTEDLNHGQRINGIKIINPYRDYQQDRRE